MSIIFGILLTLGILSFVVFIHEMGHFLTARMTKMKVEEFGIGIPPRAKSLFQDSKGTTYTLNWLPIGGFVRIKGEDPSSIDATENDSFSAKKWWARALVLIAGVTMNFILAWLIFAGLFWHGSSPLAVNFLLQKNYGSYFLPSIEESLNSGYLKHDGIEIEPISGGSAEKFGISKGDILIKVDNNDIKTIDELIEFIKKNNPMEFTLIKHSDHSTYKVGVMPMNGKIQAYLRYANFTITQNFENSFSFGTSLKKGFTETIILSRVTLDFLGKTFHDLVNPNTPADRELAKEMVAGPIGMGAGMVHLVDMGISFHTLLLMIGFLSVNLGVLNILPFPALDGGRLASTTIMTCIGFFTRKRQTLHIVEQSIHALGMILLIGLSILVAVLDILKL